MSLLMCNFCGVSKATSRSLNAHINRTHTKQNDYLKCYFCSRFIHTANLESHIVCHTKEQPYMCHFKCTSYSFKSSLDKHYKNCHSGFKLSTKPISVSCYFCGRNNKTPSCLENHLRTAHTLEKPFKCDFSKCLRTFPTRAYKNKHFINYCTENPRRRKDELKKITCYFCHVKLSRKHFYLHTNGHTGEKPFQCLNCNLWFSHPKVRNRHILLKHKSHLQHKCSFCGVSKVTLDELNRHIRLIHTKDGKKCKCYFCKKVFSLLVPHNHMVVHTNEFHHKCKFCPAEYRASESLKYHYFKSHAELVDARKIKSQFCVSCKICGDKFYSSQLLLTHVKSHQRNNKYFETEATSRKNNRGVPISELIDRAYRNCKVVPR